MEKHAKRRKSEKNVYLDGDVAFVFF